MTTPALHRLDGKDPVRYFFVCIVTATKMGQENGDHEFTKDLSTPDVCSHLAAREDHWVATTQLSQDDDADIDAGLGYTPLTWAAYRCPCGAVSQLLASGADSASQDTDKFLALHIAAGKGHLLVVELLLQLPGINVNAQDKHGSTALHKAVYKGCLPIIELLL
ncbi:ankyrin repeat domain-containing protein 44 [Aspergillus brasiliensis]|nr:ankyrin repeat domain-containing protein 44 [Aspergillus brasiliensis]